MCRVIGLDEAYKVEAPLFLVCLWLTALMSHLAAASKEVAHNSIKEHNIFSEIVCLYVGEALNFSPSALLSVEKTNNEAPSMLQKLGLPTFTRVSGLVLQLTKGEVYAV